MNAKADHLLDIINNIKLAAQTRGHVNRLVGILDSKEIRGKLEARSLLGEDPDMGDLEALYAQVKAAVDQFNGNQIEIPTLAEIAAGLEAAGNQS